MGVFIDFPYANRREAGRELAQVFLRVGGNSQVLVVGLPRGGIPIAFEIAKALGAALDVCVVRKLGVPGHEELAMGAIAAGMRVINEDVIGRLGITLQQLEAVAGVEREIADRREKMYRGGQPPLAVKGKTVILVDDGLATGATMRAAAEALEKLGPRRLIVAVPVGAGETCRRVALEVDELICLATPEPFHAVGEWYGDFSPTSDEEVMGLLAEARGWRPVDSGGRQEPPGESPGKG